MNYPGRGYLRIMATRRRKKRAATPVVDGARALQAAPGATRGERLCNDEEERLELRGLLLKACGRL